MATLYLVSTPIGNLEDIGRRAARVLGEVDRVLAEDTRRTGRLLAHLDVSVPLVSLHAHNEAERSASVLAWLEAGEDLALVSDAGTPLVSDPGERLVGSVAEAGHGVVPIPGPSAVLAALVASGLPAVPFVFLGFPPRSGRARTEFIERVATSGETAVLFESPQRAVRLLEDLVGACGSERPVAVARELTKLHEDIYRGTLAGALNYHEEGRVRGEIAVVVAPAASPPPGAVDPADEAAALALTEALLERGLSPSRAAREVARRLGLPRNAAYDLIHRDGGANST